MQQPFGVLEVSRGTIQKNNCHFRRDVHSAKIRLRASLASFTFEIVSDRFSQLVYRVDVNANVKKYPREDGSSRELHTLLFYNNFRSTISLFSLSHHLPNPRLSNIKSSSVENNARKNKNSWIERSSLSFTLEYIHSPYDTNLFFPLITSNTFPFFFFFIRYQPRSSVQSSKIK